jgi:AcrR family transcriptional regulator
MSRPKPDKLALLIALEQHVLAHGLNSASLRPLAAAADTSDRMLIYHFGSKDGLIRALLLHLAQRIEAALTQTLPAGPFASETALIIQVVTLMRAPAYRPYMRLWFDIVSAAAQGQQAHLQAGRAIVDSYLAWIAARHPQGPAGAAHALALIEGALLMDVVGQSSLADAALASLTP